MRILHITAQKPNSTGSGIYLKGIVNSLNDKSIYNGEIKNAVVTGIDFDDSVEEIENEIPDTQIYPIIFNNGKVPFHVPGMSDNMPYPATRYRDLKPHDIDILVGEMKMRIKEAIEKFRPDIIISHHLYLISSVAEETVEEIGARDRIGMFAICHGTCLRQLDSINLDHSVYGNSYIIEKIKKYDRVFSLHGQQKKDIENKFSIDPHKVHVLGSGYDSSFFYERKDSVKGEFEKLKKECSYNGAVHIDDDKKSPTYKNGKEKSERCVKLIYAGKLAKSKGLVSFFKAVSTLNEKTGSNIKVSVAGGGSDKLEVEEIRKAASECGAEVDFMGKLSQRELGECMRNSDIFVLPSFYEGLPVVILEALACGCKVVTTAVKGVKEWIGDEINSSGMIDYVKLPEMKKIDEPYEEGLEKFEKELAKSVEKMMEKTEFKHIETDRFSWKGLSKMLYKNIQEYEAPFDACRKPGIAVLDCRAGENTRKLIKDRGIDIVDIPMLSGDKLYEGLRAHPDILLCPLDKKNIVVSKDLYDEIRENEKLGDINIIEGESYITKKYPGDIRYNVCIVGNRAIHNFKYTDPVLLNEIEKRGLEKIDISQGYSKCSICVVDSNSVITSDEGVKRALEEKNIEVLKISPGHIKLSGLSYGFIGGCSGKIDSNTMIFSGNMKTHPDYERIKDFLKQRNIEMIFAEDEELEDFGTLMFF